MAILRYGRYSTTAESDIGFIASNKGRISVYNALTSTIIVYKGGFFGGRRLGGSTPGSRVAVRGVSGLVPSGNKLGYTGQMSPSTVMEDVAGGAKYEANAVSPFVLRSGNRYALELTSYGAGLGHSMKASASLPTADNTDFYDETITSSIPPDPYAGSDIGNNGHLTVWVEGDINVKPNVPTSLSPTGNISSTTPTMAATFSDPNETLSNGVTFDKVKQFQIQVKNAAGTIIWDTTLSATPSEQTAKRPSRTYGGTALATGQTYQHRWRMSDQADAWSDFTGWTSFTINPGGSVAAPTAPTGKQLSLQPTPFTAVWSHVTPLNADQVKVRIKQGGTVIATSGAITLSPTVANGGTISVTWAQTGFSSSLLQAGINNYTVEMQARDTGAVWSPWSSGTAFSENAPPNKPTSLAPTTLPQSSLPLLTFIGSDPDDINSALTATFELTVAGPTVLTRTGTWDAALGKYKYQTTGTDLTTTQTFTWRAKLSDGTLTGAWSDVVSTIYGSGPAVTITAPTANQVLAVSNPTVTWTATGQVSYRVYVYRVSDDVLVHDSGTVTSGTQTYTVPSGVLFENVPYYVIVAVTNSVPLTGYSSPTYFSIDYTAPPALTGVSISPARIRFDSVPTAVQMSWDAPDYPPGQVQKITIKRRESGQDLADAITLVEIPEIVQTGFTDFRPRSGTDYIYTITYSVLVGADTLESVAVEGPARVDLKGVVLSAVVGGDTYRAELLYDTGRRYRWQNDRKKSVPLGAKKGRSRRSPYSSWEETLSFKIPSDTIARAIERIEDIHEMLENADTICYRDDRRRISFVTIDDYEETDTRPSNYTVSMSLSDEQFTEGVKNA